MSLSRYLMILPSYPCLYINHKYVIMAPHRTSRQRHDHILVLYTNNTTRQHSLPSPNSPPASSPFLATFHHWLSPPTQALTQAQPTIPNTPYSKLRHSSSLITLSSTALHHSCTHPTKTPNLPSMPHTHHHKNHVWSFKPSNNPHNKHYTVNYHDIAQACFAMKLLTTTMKPSLRLHPIISTRYNYINNN